MRANDCWPPTELPQIAQIFAYGVMGLACDADSQGNELSESNDYVTQSILEVASLLSISAGRQASVKMTVDKFGSETQTDAL